MCYGVREISIVVILLGATTPGFAVSECEQKIFAKYANSNNLENAYLKTRRDPHYAACRGPMAAAKELVAAKSEAKARLPAAKNNETKIEPTSNFSRTFFVLRHDFADVWLFQEPADPSDATGAEFSYTSDRVAHNNSWAAHGMASFIWQTYGDYGKGNAPGFLGISFGPYVEVDYLKNSNIARADSNVETWTTGALAEMGWDALGGQHYLRARGAAVSDRIAESTTGSAVLEWIPVYRQWNIGSPSALPFAVPIIYRFSPELKARYDSLPIADGARVKQYDWRVGPQFTLFYKFFQGEATPELLRRLGGRITYSTLYSTSSSRHFEWLETSLTYNLDPDGHVGLTGTYKNGKVEETAKRTDLYKVGLSAKW